MTQPQVEALTKYIRVTGDLNAEFIEFDFAIHDPSLFVELVLPKHLMIFVRPIKWLK